MLNADQKKTTHDFWVQNHTNPQSIFDGMNAYGVGILDLADAIGVTPEYIYTYCRIHGMPDGFGGFIAQKPPVWQDIYINFNELHKYHYGAGFNRAWTADPDSVYQKIQLDNEYIGMLNWWNSTHVNKFLIPAPTWLDTYLNWLVSDYFPKYHDVINRPWNADSDAANQKAALDQMYIGQLRDYNIKNGTKFAPNPAEMGPNAQPNTYNANHTGGFLGENGVLILAAIAVIAVVVFAPELLPSIPTFGEVASGAKTASTIYSGVNTVTKLTSGAPVTGLDVLKAGATISDGSDLITNYFGGAAVDTVTTYETMDDGSVIYTYSNGAMQHVAYDGTILSETGAPYIDAGVTVNGDIQYTVNTDGSITETHADGTTVLRANDGDYSVTDPYGNTSYHDTTGAIIPPVSKVDPANWSFAELNRTLAQVTGSVSAVLATVAAVKRLGNPQPVNAGTVRTANGATISTGRDGRVITRNPDGSISTGVVPVGRPYTFPDGTTIVNNGDGTFTTIKPDGSSTVSNLPKVGGAGMSSALLFGGFGLMALLLLKKGK